jgi:branched-chain amino acid transport system permease protein
MTFFFEVLIGGLLAGVMYSLVALGFVLIYKASGVFNFAQGAMVFFAALTFVGLQEKFSLPFWGAFVLALAAMVVLGILIERIVLRPLVNQPQITLFMATIGLSFFIEGLAQLIWGTNVRRLDIGIKDEPIAAVLQRFDMAISSFDLTAAAVAGVLVAVLAVFFPSHARRPGIACGGRRSSGRAGRGHSAQTIWAIVWSVAGFVALVAGLMWGARNGVQFALTFVALKALPVLILGGFESVPGAIVGGLIIGAWKNSRRSTSARTSAAASKAGSPT